MTAEHLGLGNDFWDNEYDLGTSSTWRFAGAEGLARLSGPFEVTADPVEEFAAKLSRVQLDHVALEALESTPHTSSRSGARLVTHPTPLLSFILLLDGRARVELDDSSFALHSGDCFVADSRDPLTYTSSTTTRVLHAAIGLEHVPEMLHRRGATIPGVLRRTPLVDSFVAFISSILTTTASGQQARGSQLIRAVAELQSAVLAEAQELHLAHDGAVGLRYRMEQYIEAGYRDPDLDPEAVAQAFHISLRQAHVVFNDDERTIARFIRDRRVAAAALELRTAKGSTPLSDLARRHGFRNPDNLSRAFQQRFAMTPTDYRNGGHRHLG